MEYTAVDYREVERVVGEISADPAAFVGTLTRSILGRDIPMITLGKGKKTVLYVGAHHGMEGSMGTVPTRPTPAPRLCLKRTR